METLKDYLEILYFISGPIIAVFAFYGLRQIKEAKHQVQELQKTRVINCKRDSYVLAAEKCTYYLEKIVPQINTLDTDIREKNFSFFKNSIIDETDTAFSLKPIFKDKTEFEAVFNLNVLPVFNELEAVSVFFISGVASEKIGFMTIGHTFCSTIKNYLPYMILLSSGKHFNNCLSLYKLWHNKIVESELKKEKNKLEGELDKIKIINIKEIGTE